MLCQISCLLFNSAYYFLTIPDNYINAKKVELLQYAQNLWRPYP